MYEHIGGEGVEVQAVSLPPFFFFFCEPRCASIPSRDVDEIVIQYSTRRKMWHQVAALAGSSAVGLGEQVGRNEFEVRWSLSLVNVVRRQLFRWGVCAPLHLKPYRVMERCRSRFLLIAPHIAAGMACFSRRYTLQKTLQVCFRIIRRLRNNHTKIFNLPTRQESM